MASRVAEVIYRLKDLFTGPVNKVKAGYRELSREAKRSADAVEGASARQGKALAGLGGGVSKLLGSWRALGAATGATAGLFTFKGLIDEADQLGKAAQKVNLTSEALSKLSFAASRNNVDFRTLEIGLQRMERRIGDALNGSTELQKTFAKLGLDVRELSRLSADQAFLKIADAVKNAGSETEKLSLFIKIFDAEAANLIRVANQGSDGIRALGDEAERLGKVFGSDFTRQAAEFNDQLTNLGAQLDGAKIRAFSGPLKELVGYLEQRGFGDRRAGLEGQLALLEEQINRPWYERLFGFRGHQSRTQMIADIIALRQELDRFNTAQAASAAEAEAAQRSAAAQREAYAQTEQALSGLEVAQKDRLETLKKTLREETAELDKARKAQLDVERDFAALREEITRPDQAEVYLGDVSLIQRQAQVALERGETEQAIKLARQGGDLLGLLKEKGSESQQVLAYFARQLEAVAKTAAQTDVAKEALDAQKIEEQVALATAHLAQLTYVMKNEGAKAGQAFIDELTRVITAAPLPAPTVAAPSVSARNAPRVQSDGASFSDGTDYRAPLDKAGLK